MNEIIESQSNLLGINDFISKATQYTNENFPELDISQVFKESITGNMGNILGKIDIFNFFSNELSYAIQIMIDVIIIIIINSIFKAIIENLGNSNSAQITYFLQYMVIVSLVINTFVSILDYTKESINSVINFMNLLVPLLITLMLSTGTIVTTTIVEPILLIMIGFVGNFINIFLIPLLMISITISIVSNISDKLQIERLSKFLKSSIVWLLGILLTIFTTTLSLQGTLTSSVDGMTAKTAKAVVSNFIPVVGKIMGDTVDSVIGCSNILKNSVGIIGVIVIIGIVLEPIIKIFILWMSFKLTSAVCEVVADTKIVKLIDQISDGYKILLGILVSVSVMFVIGITLVIKMTNTALMYR
jgi:stage III sporulation protein AE